MNVKFPYAGILVNEGTETITNPPQIDSFSRQSDLLFRKHPDEFFPHSLVSSITYEDQFSHPNSKTQPISCIDACSLNNTLYIFSGAGVTRDVLSMAIVPDWPNSPTNTTFHSRYARTSGPILQVSLNSTPPPPWKHHQRQYLDTNTIAMNSPLIAARSRHAIDFYQVSKIEDRSQQHNTEGTILDSNLRKLGTILSTPGSSTSCFAWNRCLPHSGALLQDDGTVFEVSFDQGTGSPLSQCSWYPPSATDFLPRPDFLPQTHTSTTSPSQPSTHPLHCAFFSSHPRKLALSLDNQLGVVDLRYGCGKVTSPSSFLSLYTCLPGQWITALCTNTDSIYTNTMPTPTPTSNSNHTSNNNNTTDNYIVASTPTHIHLFDIRRPHAPLLSIPHYITDGVKPSTLGDIYGTVPDALYWLPGKNGIVVASTSLAKGVVVEWTEERSRGHLVVEEGGTGLGGLGGLGISRSSGGSHQKNERRIREYSSPQHGKDTSNLLFEYNPLCWNDIKGHEGMSPLLLFDMSGALMYPASIADAFRKVVALRRQKHCHPFSTTRTRRRRMATDDKDFADENNTNTSNNNNISNDNNSNASILPEQTSLLPAAISLTLSRPITAGISLVLHDWLSGESLPLPSFVMLLSAQEILMSTLQFDSSSECSDEIMNDTKIFTCIRPALRHHNNNDGDDTDNVGKDTNNGAIDTNNEEDMSEIVNTKHGTKVALPIHTWYLEEAIKQYTTLSTHNNNNNSGDILVHEIQVPTTLHEVYKSSSLQSPSTIIDQSNDTNNNLTSLSRLLLTLPPPPSFTMYEVPGRSISINQPFKHNQQPDHISSFAHALQRIGILGFLASNNNPIDSSQPDFFRHFVGHASTEWNSQPVWDSLGGKEECMKKIEEWHGRGNGVRTVKTHSASYRSWTKEGGMVFTKSANDVVLVPMQQLHGAAKSGGGDATAAAEFDDRRVVVLMETPSSDTLQMTAQATEIFNALKSKFSLVE